MEQETALVSDALRSVAALLPASWRLDTSTGRGCRVDAVVALTGPHGARATFVVEAKRSGSVPVGLLLASLRELVRCGGLPVLYLSDYIGPGLRRALTAEGLSFADATGWVRVTSDEPLILLTGEGAARPPRSRRRIGAVTRLNGIAASRIVRALSVADPPIGVRALAGLAEVAPGSVSKLLATLAAEGIVDRGEDGVVTAIRRRALIRRWAVDYSFTTTNSAVRYCIAPRGLDRSLTRLSRQPGVAVTGSAAARRLLPPSVTSVVPLRLLALYAADPSGVTDDVGLIDAEPATANVILARPQDGRIVPSARVGDAAVAPVGLVLVDLLTLPRRSDAEAEQLMDFLGADDPAWRR